MNTTIFNPNYTMLFLKLSSTLPFGFPIFADTHGDGPYDNKAYTNSVIRRTWNYASSMETGSIEYSFEKEKKVYIYIPHLHTNLPYIPFADKLPVAAHDNQLHWAYSITMHPTLLTRLLIEAEAPAEIKALVAETLFTDAPPMVNNVLSEDEERIYYLLLIEKEDKRQRLHEEQKKEALQDISSASSIFN